MPGRTRTSRVSRNRQIVYRIQCRANKSSRQIEDVTSPRIHRVVTRGYLPHSSAESPIAETIYHVIVDHAYRLHEGIADSGTDKIKSALLQIFAHRIRGSSSRGQLLRRPQSVHLRLAVHELPDIAIEGTKLFLYTKKCFGIRNRGCNLQAITDDAWITQQAIDLAAVVSARRARDRIRQTLFGSYHAC